MSNGRFRLIMMMAALCFSTFSLMGDTILIPIGDFLYAEYGNVSQVNYVLTGHVLVAALATIFAGRIIERIGARRLLLIGYAVYMLAAVASAISQDIIILILSKSFQGLGMGCVTVCVVVVISQQFPDERQRGKMVGIYSAMMSLIGALLGLAAGFVASYDWHLVFQLYWVSAPIYILLILFIPEDIHVVNAANVANEAKRDNNEFNKKPITQSSMPWSIVLRVALANFAIGAIYSAGFYEAAVIVSEKGILDTAYVGLLTALGTAGSFVTCTLFGPLFAYLRRYTPTLCFGLMSVLFVTLYFAESQIILMVCYTGIGAVFGIAMSYYSTYATMVVPADRVPTSTAICSFSASCSSFISTYIPYFVMSVVGVSTVCATLPLLATVLGAGFVLSFVFAKSEKRYFADWK